MSQIIEAAERTGKRNYCENILLEFAFPFLSILQSLENMTCVRFTNPAVFLNLQRMLLRQIIVGFVALAILAQQGSKTFILLDYLVNKKYVATVLCENRDRPLLHCNGKCHLKKEFKKDDAKQGSEKQNSNIKNEISHWENHSSSPLRLTRFSKTISIAPGIVHAFYSAPLSAPFHPPC